MSPCVNRQATFLRRPFCGFALPLQQAPVCKTLVQSKLESRSFQVISNGFCERFPVRRLAFGIVPPLASSSVLGIDSITSVTAPAGFLADIGVMMIALQPTDLGEMKGL